MGVLWEVIRALGYTAFGVFIGYQFCKMRRSVEEIKENVVTEDTKVSPPRQYDRRRVFGDRQSRIIGILVLTMSTVTIVSSLYTNHQTRDNTDHDTRVTECQTKFNQDFARILTVRGQYADEDRTALNTMIFTVITETDANKRKLAVETWVTVTQRNDKLRKATPIPSLEARDCGEKSSS